MSHFLRAKFSSGNPNLQCFDQLKMKWVCVVTQSAVSILRCQSVWSCNIKTCKNHFKWATSMIAKKWWENSWANLSPFSGLLVPKGFCWNLVIFQFGTPPSERPVLELQLWPSAHPGRSSRSLPDLVSATAMEKHLELFIPVGYLKISKCWCLFLKKLVLFLLSSIVLYKNQILGTAQFFLAKDDFYGNPGPMFLGVSWTPTSQQPALAGHWCFATPLVSTGGTDPAHTAVALGHNGVPICHPIPSMDLWNSMDIDYFFWG